MHEQQAAGRARAVRAGEAVYEHRATGRERTFDKVEELLDEGHHLLLAGWLLGLREYYVCVCVCVEREKNISRTHRAGTGGS